MNLWKALECEESVTEDTYTFVTPDSFEDFEGGVSLEISSQCNADFVDSLGDTCAVYGEFGWCYSQSAEFFVYFGVPDADGVYETGLNCPQCGCGADGAENLNNILADSDTRKPFEGPILKQWVPWLHFFYLSET